MFFKVVLGFLNLNVNYQNLCSFLYAKIVCMQKKKKTKKTATKVNFKMNEFQKLMNQNIQKIDSRNFRQVKINMPRRPK
jgi:hypothetical protein